MYPDSSSGGISRHQGEVIVKFPGASGQVGALGTAAPQSMITFTTFAVELDSSPAVRTVALDLIDRRRWFTVISLPGDVWVVSVKTADREVLEGVLTLRQIQVRPPHPELMQFGE